MDMEVGLDPYHSRGAELKGPYENSHTHTLFICMTAH